MTMGKMHGSMTVFFSICISAVCMLMVVLFLVENVVLASMRGRQIMDLCGESVLAGYNRDLYENYGFFAVESTSIAEQDFTFFYAENMNPYRAGDVSLNPSHYLTDQTIFEEQLGAFMQIRFPLTLADQYTDLLQHFGEIEDVSTLMDNEIQISELIEPYQTHFSVFIGLLEGIDDYGNHEPDYVKGFWNELYVRSSYEEIIDRADENATSALSYWESHLLTYESILEEAISEWKALTSEGVKVRPQLTELLQNTEDESQKKEIQNILDNLHTGGSSDRTIQNQLNANLEAVQTSRKGLTTLQDHSEDTTAKTQARKLLQYTTDIYVAYEVEPINRKLKSWRKIWNEMQDYVTDLSAYVNADSVIAEDGKGVLPSGGQADSSVHGGLSLTELSGELGQDVRFALSATLNKAYCIEYLNGMFWDLRDTIAHQEDGTVPISLKGSEMIEGAFQTETEYVIAGKKDDLSNCQSIRFRIVGLRMLSNLYFLYTNPEKKAAIESMSYLGGIVCPGIGNKILRGLITAIWAAAESYNDYERLIRGERVPVLKGEDDWRTDLEHVAENWKEESKNEGQETGKGLLYADYLKVLLLLEPTATVEKRILDLIQLNLEKQTGKTLRLAQMVTDFEVDGTFYDKSKLYTVKGEYGY